MWSDLQLAYFAGYAMWTYLNTPFLLARPGVESEEGDPWQESGETWRRLNVRFPADIATHSTEQSFYFDQQGLLRRQDYNVEIDGGTVRVTYTLTSPGCPIGPQVSEQIEEFVSEIDGVQEVQPTMTFSPPWTPDRMSEDAKFALGF